MSTVVCKGCSGQYETIMGDGSRYFHTCPPSVKPSERRDENPPSTKEVDASKMKAAGLDVTVVKA